MLTATDDINLLVNYWSCLFAFVIDKHAPFCERNASEKYCPWVDKALKDLIHSRDNLKTATVKGKSQFLMNS